MTLLEEGRTGSSSRRTLKTIVLILLSWIVQEGVTRVTQLSSISRSVSKIKAL
ncbi:hypothetical protein YC2023_044443 [Brassica napus]